MQQVRLTDNLTLSRVVAGMMRSADERMDDRSLMSFTEQCLDMGVDSFDHAPVYGGYTCEKRFGDAVLRKNPALRSRMKLVTKAGIVLPGRKDNRHIYYDSRAKSLLEEMDESLMRLGTDHVDLLLVHRPDPLAHPAETAEALDRIVKEGKALNVGVSNYTPAQMDALSAFLKTPLATNQLEFSVKTVDNFFNGVSDDLFRRGMKPMAWSPLGGGSVFNGTDEQSLRLRDTLGEIAQCHKVPMDIVMFAWLLKHPLEIMPVTGTMNIERVKRAVDALALELSYDEWYAVLAAARGYDVP